MNCKLKNDLKRWTKENEIPAFITNDPIQFPHRYHNRKDIEISAFVTAWIAWGSRKQIIQKADFVDRILFKGAPLKYIKNEEWRVYSENTDSFYRTYKHSDFHDLCERLHEVYTSFETMEAAIKANLTETGTVLDTLRLLFGSVKGIPDETSKSACKRLCMFLRWMCRTNSPVDFGLWTCNNPCNLIIPLDTHVDQQALQLKLTNRRTADMTTAIEITNHLAEVFPDDPTKGDFALFGIGVVKEGAKD